MSTAMHRRIGHAGVEPNPMRGQAQHRRPRSGVAERDVGPQRQRHAGAAASVDMMPAENDTPGRLRMRAR
jgi:hypothetical protein